MAGAGKVQRAGGGGARFDNDGHRRGRRGRQARGQAWADGDAGYTFYHSRHHPIFPHGKRERAVGMEHLHAAIVTVGDVNATVGADGDAAWSPELPVALPM